MQCTTVQQRGQCETQNTTVIRRQPMSSHASIRGEIHYDTRTELENTLTYLSDNGWKTVPLSKTIHRINPADTTRIHGYKTQQDNSETSEWVLCIPDNHYRNLMRVLPRLRENAIKSLIVSTTTNGFYGETITHEIETKQYLDEWVNNHYPELYNEKPCEDEYTTKKAWFDVYIKWQNECEKTYRTHQAHKIGLQMHPQATITARSIHSHDPNK